MVLQRWQTVYLLIAVIAMSLAAFIPAVAPADPAFTLDYCAGLPLVFRLLGGLTALLLLVTIFKFRNLKFQKQLCSVGALLSVVSCVVVAMAYFLLDISLKLQISSALPLLSLVCTMLAKSRIISDYKLIHDSERLR